MTITKRRVMSQTGDRPALRAFPLLLVLLLGCSWTAPAQRGDGIGKRDPVLQPCDEAWDHGRRVEALRCYQQVFQTSPSIATQAEAAWGLHDVKQANELFRAAVDAEPDNPDLRVRWGYLFLQTHNPAEAAQLFDEALKMDESHVPAKLGKATVLAARFEGQAHELAKEAIEAAPDLVEGHLLLARMAIEEEEFETADEQLRIAEEKAGANQVSPLEVYSLRAALEMMRGPTASEDVTQSEWIDKALAYNPTYGKAYADLGHFYVITRRYREAIALYRKAVETDPELWSAHADLAVNLMREGLELEAQQYLEISYNGDPYSAQTVNTLRLIDSLKDFRNYSNKADVVLGSEQELTASIEKPEVILKLHQSEAEVLRPYIMELAEKSIETFAKKYQFEPQSPVRIEFYPNHDDFAVRTMGMPGLGLLGVTFGYVVAMDSPSGRKPGTFHWGTTLWHELAHVFSLEATNHLVPRWYSEGLSMYEEWAAKPQWGEQLSPDFIRAVQEDRLLPVAELDRGFLRPRYPNQVAISYFQAGLVCKMIAETRGFPKLVQLLRGFGDGKETAENFEEVLGIPAEEFDKEFAAYVEKESGPALEGFKEWQSSLKQMLEAAGNEDWPAVIETGERARDLFPNYLDAGNPYMMLARAHEESGDQKAAMEELRQYAERGGYDPATIKKLAGWLDEAGRRQEAIAVLEELIYSSPADPEIHSRLGDWYLEANRLEAAAREFGVILAANPLDMAGAHFNLARTYHKMKDRERTRKHLLAALESAPSYRPAQRLLLEITQ